MCSRHDIAEILLIVALNTKQPSNYENRACNVGKSILASILIDGEILQSWKPTDGLIIYFGRNEINLKDKTMVPLRKCNTTEHYITILLNVC
jgi:hypothetical protein